MDFITVPAARAGVGGRNKRDRAGKLCFQMCATQSNDTFFERLPQLIQHVSRKFSQFIEEQHPSMGEADFARTGAGTSTQQSGGTAAVVRCTKRRVNDQA